MHIIIWSLAIFIIILLIFQFRYHLKLALAGIVLLMVLALGNPQPWPIYSGEVLAHYLINDKAIVVWLKQKRVPWPTSMILPWDEETAKELSSEEYQLGQFRLDYEFSWDAEKQPLVRRKPPARLPLKPVDKGPKPLEMES